MDPVDGVDRVDKTKRRLLMHGAGRPSFPAIGAGQTCLLYFGDCIHPWNPIMLKFALLGSGSSGNATVVTDGRSTVLIDNGLSYVRLAERLGRVGLSPDRLDAVFITHEHSDHVTGLGVLSRKVRVPIFASTGTCGALPKGLGDLPNLVPFESGDTVPVGNLSIGSFSVSHDAEDPVSYTVTNSGTKLGFATDFGHVSQLVQTRLAGAHALVLESNYCPDMLRTGSYPPAVRQRISSRVGHLSNHDAMRLLKDLAHDHLKIIVLVHLSQQNNLPDLPLQLARKTLRNHPAEIIIAAPNGESRLFEVSA